MIRQLKFFKLLYLVLAGALISTVILAKRSSLRRPASHMSSSSLSAPLNLTSLTDGADLIAVGSVVTVWEQGSTTIKIGNDLVAARQKVALLSVDRILKGQADGSSLNFKFLTSDAIVYRDIPMSQVEMFFLRETSPGEYAILDPFHPFVIAAEHAPPAEGGPLDKVVANLAHLLTNPAASLDSRMEAIRALRSAKTEAATSALRQGAQEQNISLRLEAAAALLRRNDISTLDMVAKSLLEPSEDISDPGRGDAVFALDGITDPRAIPTLSHLLSKGDVEIRRRAAVALRHTHSSEAIGALARALDDSDQQVRYSAVAGLAEITGETKWMPSIPLFKEDESPYLAHWHERVSKLISSQQR